MAIVTPRFIIGVTTYDLPHASEYRYTADYSSVPLRMANGRTVWQTFVKQGDDEPGFFHRIMVSWKQMTDSERNVLITVFDDLRAGTLATFRTPDNVSYSVAIDPDHPTWEFEAFSAYGGTTLFYRTTIYLVQDTS